MPEVLPTILRVGATRYLAFAAHVKHAGIYLLSLRAAMACEERSVSDEAGAVPDNPTSWTAHR
jgi:hypothetical protein